MGKFYLVTGLLFLTSMTYGQDSTKQTSYNLHFNLGISIVSNSYTTGPSMGLEIINPVRRFSFAYKGEYPFSIGNDQFNHNLRIIRYQSQQYFEIKFNTIEPERSLLTGSVGVCWIYQGHLSSYWLNPENGRYLITASLSYPVWWLQCEIRYNLLPKELSADNVASYSTAVISFYYRFKPFPKY